ncbi:MAG: hypothetical protein PsegKO_19360 [Pseudohongiellaceae bacterium]
MFTPDQLEPGQPDYLDNLTASLLYLMTRFTVERTRSLAAAITHHLQLLEAATATSSGALANSAIRLREHWARQLQSLAFQTAQPPRPAGDRSQQKLH